MSIKINRCQWCNTEVREYPFTVDTKGFCSRTHAKNYTDLKGGEVKKQKIFKFAGNKLTKYNAYETRK